MNYKKKFNIFYFIMIVLVGFSIILLIIVFNEEVNLTDFHGTALALTDKNTLSLIQNNFENKKILLSNYSPGFRNNIYGQNFFYQDNEGSLYILNISTYESKKIVDIGDEDNEIINFFPSPDGKKIIYGIHKDYMSDKFDLEMIPKWYIKNLDTEKLIKFNFEVDAYEFQKHYESELFSNVTETEVINWYPDNQKYLLVYKPFSYECYENMCKNLLYIGDLNGNLTLANIDLFKNQKTKNIYNKFINKIYFSNDLKYFIYQETINSDDNESKNIYIYNTELNTKIEIENKDKSIMRFPKWSPKSDKILIMKENKKPDSEKDFISDYVISLEVFDTNGKILLSVPNINLIDQIKDFDNYGLELKLNGQIHWAFNNNLIIYPNGKNYYVYDFSENKSIKIPEMNFFGVSSCYPIYIESSNIIYFKIIEKNNPLLYSLLKININESSSLEVLKGPSICTICNDVIFSPM